MSLAGPTVRRLRLRADSESAVRRAMPAIEDAFRTATWPDVGARLVFVRRLTLGRLPRAASTQSLSLALESRFAAMDCRPVHAADEGADHAPAVWFRDPLEAHEIAARRVAAGRPVDAWFWPRVIPALAGPASSGEKLRAIVFSLAGREEAPAALPAWTAAVVDAGHGERLLAVLQPGDGEALMRSAGRWSAASGRAAAGRAPDPDGGSRRNLPPVVLDDRIEFLELMTNGTRRPMNPDPSAGRSDRTREPVAALHHPLTQGPSESRAIHEPADPAPVTDTGEGADAQHLAEKMPARRLPAPDQASSGTASTASGDHASGAVRGPLPVSADRQRSEWASTAGVTAAGGLLFLVPALERAGFGEWWSREAVPPLPPDALARQIFSVLLDRLRIPDDDPAWQLAAPARSPGVVPEVGALATHWLTTCRRMLRRRAQIGLATLVVRPAQIVVTATHADVFLPLSAADVRVRRAGLDIDPGWVPWLAKVVTFHYADHRPRDHRQ